MRVNETFPGARVKGELKRFKGINARRRAMTLAIEEEGQVVDCVDKAMTHLVLSWGSPVPANTTLVYSFEKPQGAKQIDLNAISADFADLEMAHCDKINAKCSDLIEMMEKASLTLKLAAQKLEEAHEEEHEGVEMMFVSNTLAEVFNNLISMRRMATTIKAEQAQVETIFEMCRIAEKHAQ